MRQHIFDDLQPYVCIESNCADPHHLYKRQREWIQHVRHTHWMRWECPAGCPMSFAAEENLMHHMETKHAELAESHLESLVALGRRPGMGFRDSDCPLCLQRLTTEVKYQEHIGRHQERIAVLALPLEEIHADKYQEIDNHALGQGTEENLRILFEETLKIPRGAKSSTSSSVDDNNDVEYSHDSIKPSPSTFFAGKELRWICVRQSQTFHLMTVLTLPA